MIVRELLLTREDGVALYRSYSDNKVLIRKVGTDDLFEDAIDVENSNNEYEETEIIIKSKEDDDDNNR